LADVEARLRTVEADVRHWKNTAADVEKRLYEAERDVRFWNNFATGAVWTSAFMGASCIAGFILIKVLEPVT
jgi:hypothetical protein